MTFYAGIIIGMAIGAILLSIFYALLIRLALKNKKETSDEFLEIQTRNGEHLERIADQLEFFNSANKKQ